MKKILLVPDSFKGSISAQDFCALAQTVIRRHFPACEVISVPVADGGEGSVDCFLTAQGGEKRCLTVQGPLGEPTEACYGILPTGEAVVEMAAAAGLPLLAGRLDVLHSNTYGVGQLMAAALDAGCRKLIVGLGGSCTNDGGCGAAAALGIRFYDSQGGTFIPSGATLSRIARIDAGAGEPRLKAGSLEIMCDIDNPMHGPQGAAHVFAPQKGAAADTVALLDEGLRHLDAIIQRDLGVAVADRPGSGAAGGMGAGLCAFFGGVLKPGIDVVLNTVNFEQLAADADLIFTGEGRLDSQSLGGKVVLGVCRRAHRLNTPVIALSGALQPGFEAAYRQGLTAAFAINLRPQTLEQAMREGPENLQQVLDNICRLLAGIQATSGGHA